MKLRRIIEACCLLSASAISFHCSSRASGGYADPPAEPPAPPPLAPPDAEPPAAECPLRCSEDLRDVVDCKGELRERCTGALACGSGARCVPACEAAEANRSNIGCSYVVPRVINNGSSGCHALFITNVWSQPAKIDVRYDGEALDVTGKMRSVEGFAPIAGDEIPPGTTAVLALVGLETEVVGRGLQCERGLVPLKGDRIWDFRDVGIATTGRTPAFVVTAGAPVQIHAIEPFSSDTFDTGGGGRSGALLASTSAWGTDYVVSVPADTANLSPAAAGWLQIAAAEDGTVVELQPSQRLLGAPTVAGGQAGERPTYALRRGETIQIRQLGNLSGSLVHSNKPVGVFSGAPLQVPTGVPSRDLAHTQLWPVSSLGHVYPAVRHRDRYEGTPESPVWRVVGAVDGTTLRYQPSAPAGAPVTLDRGQYVEFAASAPFVVASQDAEHPFALFAYMTGAGPYLDPGVGADDIRGGPEVVPVLADVQFLRSYRFAYDPTLPEAHLVVVRKRGANGFADVTLECAGVLDGWSPIAPDGEYEYTRIDLMRGNFAPQHGCSSARQAMQSAEPFAATMWGWGSRATGVGRLTDGGMDGVNTRRISYGYPAGAGFRPVNQVSYADLD